MAAFVTLPVSTEPIAAVMATGIFKMGNQASYARLLFPTQIGPNSDNLRALQLADIVSAFEAMDEAAESVLTTITISLKHDNDPTIPAADPEAENSAYVLFRTKNPGNGKGPSTFQVRVPNVPQDYNIGAWCETNKGLFYDPSTGLAGDKVVSVNLKPDKIARMSV